MFDKKTSEKDISDYFDETADLYFVIIKNIKSHFFCIKRNGLFYSDYSLLSEFTKRYEMKLIKADSLEELKQIYKTYQKRYLRDCYNELFDLDFDFDNSNKSFINKEVF